MLDAYDKARLNGFIGTKADLQKSEYLKGGIDAARAAGFVGGEDDMQVLLIGNQKGVMSPYDFAVAYGFRGTAKDWLDQLHGSDGMGIYELAISRGFEGSPDDFLKSLAGQDGLDAFQVAKVAGFDGDVDEWLKQLKGDKGDTGPMPAHQWDGTRLRFQLPDGSWGDWTNLKGEDGKTWDKPEDGDPGPMPGHQIDGRRIRFEKPDGTWGDWIDLATGQTVSSGGGGSLSIQKFYDGAANFPASGKKQILYFDTSVMPYGVYVWDGTQYQQVGGGEGGGTAYAVAVQGKNTSGAPIAKGAPVMATGTLGASGIITIAPMDGTDPANYKYLIGVAGADIANGATGDVVDIGKIRGFDTTAWAEGDVLWVSPTTVGALTNVEPGAGQLKMPVAFVVTDHHQNGEIMVRITPLDENAFAAAVQRITLSWQTTSSVPASGVTDFDVTVTGMVANSVQSVTVRHSALVQKALHSCAVIDNAILRFTLMNGGASEIPSGTVFHFAVTQEKH